jgi:hypothetical protein
MAPSTSVPQGFTSMAILGLVLADIFNYKAVENKVKECKDL